jgi:hypothetical protein
VAHEEPPSGGGSYRPVWQGFRSGRRGSTCFLIPQSVLALRCILGSDAAVADLLDVSRAQPRRWREGQTPDPENRDRIIGLDAVIAAIEAQKAGVYA